jgi:DNA-directed RNA polymerase subunit RPC12/RpoP
MTRTNPYRCAGCGRIDRDGAPDADGAWVCRRCWEEEAKVQRGGET